MSRGNRAAPGYPAAIDGSQAAAAATDADTSPGQPPMAKTLPTNADTKGDSAMNEESCGNGGTVESVEIQRQDFPSSHRSLEISQKTRDSHFPTAISLKVKKKTPTASAKKEGTILSR